MPERSYDYVIVGGGSAGCVLAARLSEHPGTSVLLLEAGPDWRPGDAPKAVRSLDPGRVIDRPELAHLQYPTLRAARTTAQRPTPFWRGRGLGGSSTVNGILAIRALPEDHDGWGLPGWGWDDVLPAYRRLEADADFGTEPHHGAAGPLPVIRLPQAGWGPVDRALAEAAAVAGYGWCPDHNAPTGEGASPYALNADPHTLRRVTTNDAWIEPARDRPNLVVRGDALVDRVVVDGGRAVGVRVRLDGEWQTVAAGEVVLCAGAVHSPAVLLRSGIGPGLAVADLPVGRHLQDHPITMLLLRLRDGGARAAHDRHTNVCVRYSSGLEGAGRADMMIVGMNHSPVPGVGLLGVWVNECRSEGALRLASPDPEVHPIIDEAMLSDGSDRARLRDGVRRLLDLLRTPPLADAVDGPPHDVLGAPVPDADDDAALDAWLLANARDAQHVCGTARMGAPGDDDAVVDPHCRVRGVAGLRVVDASVFPRVPRANTHLPTLAVAERAAELMMLDRP